MEKTIDFSGWLTQSGRWWIAECETGEQERDIINAEVISLTPSEILSSVSWTDRKATVELKLREQAKYSFTLKLTLDDSPYLLAGSSVLNKLAATPTSNGTCYGTANTYTENHADYAGKYKYKKDGSSKDLLAELYESAYTAGSDGKPVLRTDSYKNFPWLYPITTSDGKIAGQYKVSDESLYPIAKGYTPGYATFTGEFAFSPATETTEAHCYAKTSVSNLKLNHVAILDKSVRTSIDHSQIEVFRSTDNGRDYIVIGTAVDSWCFTAIEGFIPTGADSTRVLPVFKDLGFVPKAIGCIITGHGGKGSSGSLAKRHGGGGGAGVAGCVLNLSNVKNFIIKSYYKEAGYTTLMDTSLHSPGRVLNAYDGASAVDNSLGYGLGGGYEKENESPNVYVLNNLCFNGGDGGAADTNGEGRSLTRVKMFPSDVSTGFNLKLSAVSGGTADKGGGGGASFGKGGNGDNTKPISVGYAIGAGAGGVKEYLAADNEGGYAAAIFFY